VKGIFAVTDASANGSSLTANFRHRTPIAIRYGDMDTLGHVNNAKYLTYAEHARIRYVEDLGLWDGSQSSSGMIIARVVIDYKLPLTLQDGAVDVWTRCSRMGNKSADFETLIVTRRNGELVVAATCTVTGVAMDYQQNRSIPLPQQWRDIITAYEPALEG
jgi:acyl-CoA thioester hydrolase